MKRTVKRAVQPEIPRRSCECEHESHHKPDGFHVYGAEFPKSELFDVKTPFGTFVVCHHCTHECLAEYTAPRYETVWEDGAIVEFLEADMYRVFFSGKPQFRGADVYRIGVCVGEWTPVFSAITDRLVVVYRQITPSKPAQQRKYSPEGNYCSVCDKHGQWCEHIPEPKVTD